MNRLNFSHFYYFYIVAEEGSIKQAAEKLFVSQPTISDQIKLLEEYFDCRLFERGHRQLTLTSQGELALEYAQQVFSLSSELTQRLRHNMKLPKSSFDIGMTPFMSQYFLYDLILPLFGQEEFTVNIHQDQRHLLLAELEEGNVDMIFTDDKDSLPSGLGTYRVGVNRTFVVAHKKFKKYKKDFPNCLNIIPFFNYTGETKLKFEIQMFFAQNDINPKIVGQAEDIDLFQAITEKGLAFTVVPEVAKNRFCQSGDIIVLGEIEELQTSVWAVLKKNDKGLGYKLVKGKL